MDSIPIQLPLCSLETRTCRICGLLLPIDCFYVHRKDTGQRQHSCKACHNAKSAAHYLDVRGRKKVTAAAWYLRNRDRARAYNAAWLKANAARKVATNAAWLARNRLRQRAAIAAWTKAHPGQTRAYTIKRRQRITLNGGHYTGAEWQALKAQYDYRCLLCKRQEPEIKLTFDHVVPVSLGGTNDISNGQPLCSSCNSHKHDKVLDLR